MPEQHAVFHEPDGRAALRFERVLAHPPERVWSALIEHEQMRDWHPTPFELEPRAGGRVRYRPLAQAPEIPDGEVLAFEPPSLLSYTWGEDELRFELSPHEQGCVLRPHPQLRRSLQGGPRRGRLAHLPR